MTVQRKVVRHGWLTAAEHECLLVKPLRVGRGGWQRENAARDRRRVQITQQFTMWAPSAEGRALPPRWSGRPVPHSVCICMLVCAQGAAVGPGPATWDLMTSTRFVSCVCVSVTVSLRSCVALANPDALQSPVPCLSFCVRPLFCLFLPFLPFPLFHSHKAVPGQLGRQ